MNKIIIKIDRISAWVLFIGLMLYFVTGLSMTKGVLNTEMATKIHNFYLTYIILAAFIIHTFFAIHLAFKRWKIWNTPVKLLLISFFAIFAGFVFYVDKIYQIDYQDNSYQSSTTNQINFIANNNVNKKVNVVEDKAVKTFTKTELAKFDGQNGNKAYVAVDGNVYDLTSVFRNGNHFSHLAGTELTNAFYSYHAKKALANYPIVGTMIN